MQTDYLACVYVAAGSFIRRLVTDIPLAEALDIGPHHETHTVFLPTIM